MVTPTEPGPGLGIYFAQINQRDWMGPIQKLLERRGIYSEILRHGTCKPDECENWYRRFVQRCRSRGQEPVLLANGNLIDALMKAAAQGRPGPVEWSGMEIAAVAKPRPILQPTLLADHPQRVETEADIVQVDVGGGATQLSWSGLEVATVTKPSRTFRRPKMGEEEAKPKITRVKVKGGGVQLAFL